MGDDNIGNYSCDGDNEWWYSCNIKIIDYNDKYQYGRTKSTMKVWCKGGFHITIDVHFVLEILIVKTINLIMIIAIIVILTDTVILYYWK